MFFSVQFRIRYCLPFYVCTDYFWFGYGSCVASFWGKANHMSSLLFQIRLFLGVTYSIKHPFSDDMVKRLFPVGHTPHLIFHS